MRIRWQLVNQEPSASLLMPKQGFDLRQFRTASCSGLICWKRQLTAGHNPRPSSLKTRRGQVLVVLQCRKLEGAPEDCNGYFPRSLLDKANRVKPLSRPSSAASDGWALCDTLKLLTVETSVVRIAKSHLSLVQNMYCMYIYIYMYPHRLPGMCNCSDGVEVHAEQ